MRAALKFVLAALLSFWISLVAAQQLEVIELKSQTADQVLPTLLPLVEPGGTLTGVNNQLFLKASPRNRAEIKRALAALDKPTRWLIIHIAENREAENGARGAQAGGQVVLGSTRRGAGEARVWDTRSARHESAGQMVQTIEGGAAFIQVGRLLPIPMRQVIIGPQGAVVNETMVYRDLGRGFYAVPHLNGQRVTLEISQQAESPNAWGGAAVDTQRLSTTVAGRLGEWMELGASGKQAAHQQGGSLSIGTADVRDQRSIWLMVEEVR